MFKYPWQEKAEQRRESRRPTPKKKVYNIKPRTKKGAKEDQLYSLMRKKFLAENPVCQCGEPGCTKIATQVHHQKGRGIWLLITEYLLAVCDNCHKFIENNPAVSKEKGYSVNRID